METALWVDKLGLYNRYKIDGWKIDFLFRKSKSEEVWDDARNIISSSKTLRIMGGHKKQLITTVVIYDIDSQLHTIQYMCMAFRVEGDWKTR